MDGGQKRLRHESENGGPGRGRPPRERSGGISGLISLIIICATVVISVAIIFAGCPA